MSEPNKNLSIWNTLEATDPEHTKDFKRAGGFEGTAINPMYAIKKMTEVFGPMGKGWGIESTQEERVPVGDEILIFIQVCLWWGEETPDGKRFKHVVGPQWGGDSVVRKRRDGGTMLDDEAYKKAMTDAMLKCMSYLGIGADIHLGLYDDNKYVANAKRDFDDGSTLPKSQRPKDPEGKGATTPTGTQPGADATPAGSGSGKPNVGMTKMPEVDKDKEAQDELNALQASVDSSWLIVQKHLLEKHAGDVDAMKAAVKEESKDWLKGVNPKDKKAKLMATKIGLATYIVKLNDEKRGPV